MNKDLDNELIYQVYPVSFFDSDGDGVGDFNGITEKIPYLKKLNVDILWLNPIFTSPFMDGGYDVSDYNSINPKLGSLRDLKNLLITAHLCNMRVIMDFVPGHTSVEHRWFKESCKAERNKYSDYYIWTEHWYESEKNSLKGVSDRNGCVLTNYYSFQPSLNYGYEVVEKPWQIHYKDKRLEPLRNDICSLMKQWLEYGFDGFRIDLASSLIKNCKNDEPLIWLWNKIINEVKTVKSEAIFIAEWGNPAVSVGKCGFDVDYLNHENTEYNDLLRNEYNSNIMRVYERGHSYFNEEGKGSFVEFQKISEKLNEEYLKGKGYFSFPSGYHDIPRLSIGRSKDQMKLFYAFMFTYKFVPQLYYGDEIGLSYNYNVNKDGGYERTGARTPMQWNGGKNRGFSTCDNTYLPTNNNEEDVDSQLKDKDSILNTVIRLSLLRRTNRAFYVSSKLNVIENGYPLVYERLSDDKEFIALINPSKKTFERNIKYSEIVESNKCEFNKGSILLKGESFAILRK